MTVASDETLIRIFWACGFIPSYIFPVRWIQFVSNMVTFKRDRLIKITINIALVIAVVISLLCVLYGDTVFVQTQFGNQFSYQNSLIFKVACAYTTLMIIAFMILHIKWWRDSETKRQKVQAFVFILITGITAPIGYITDFIVPVFTGYTVIPLMSFAVLVSSIQIYLSMRKNRTLSITVPNISGHIFNSVTRPILVLDHNNVIRLENKATVTFFDCETIGKNIDEFITIDYEPQQTFFDNEFAGKAVTIKTPLGTRFCDLSLTIERDKYNDSFFKVIILRDLTELESALEQAKAASKAKSNFLSGMSHEIRTPMNSIVGFSELALDEDVSPKAKKYLENILENSDGLLQIINDILDISKIESGRMELENVPFLPQDIFDACRTMTMPKAVEKGLKMHIYAEPHVGKVPLGDPTRLRQVFTNLLSNAVKFTNKGVVRLVSSVEDISEETITVYFEVTDTGIGMTTEQIQKIFDPFIQAESGTTRKYGGTGLGLAITKNIIEMMGGSLSVESTPRVGSKFSFHLTFDTIDIGEDELLLRQIVQSELQKPMFEGEILLFEDNIMNQQVACEHLARVGLKTVVAENGVVGVKTVKNRIKDIKNGTINKQFDLIFMDMHMPEMDGLEAAAIISEMNLGIPIVAMTANVMTSDRELYEENGMNDYVGKPFTSQELWRCLLRYLKPLDWQSDDKVQLKQADDELHQMLINRFVDTNSDICSEIDIALNEGNIKLAHRLVHTLKSNAGQLGKKSLQKAAEDMENNLKDEKNLTAPNQMDVLKTEVDEQ